jgi:hypothetical protein
MWIGLNKPLSNPDIKAYNDSDLPQWVCSLPLGQYIVANNAYACTNHLLTPFLNNQSHNQWTSSFNFHLSQLQISVEQAFGLLVGKWRIFTMPVEIKLE